MIDTHSHIFDPAFDADRRDVVARAKAAGVTQVVLANVDVATITQLRDTQADHPDFCLPAMGLHPTSVDADYKKALTRIAQELDRNSYLAIGEIGLDLYWDATFLAEQQAAFETQIAWAYERDLPVIIHIRKAFAEVFASLAKFKGKLPTGVFHCFSGGIEEAKKAVSLGFYLGIGGVVTYKNSSLPPILTEIGLEHLLLETDAPYLAPVPYRGKRNEPAYLKEIAERLSAVFGVSTDEIDRQTTENARRLFRL